MTKTLENTKENINNLESMGYTKSSVSKPFNPISVLRYDTERMVYWFSGRKSVFISDCYFNQRNIVTLIIC